jgi:hypothetical protein
MTPGEILLKSEGFPTGQCCSFKRHLDEMGKVYSDPDESPHIHFYIFLLKLWLSYFSFFML